MQQFRDQDPSISRRLACERTTCESRRCFVGLRVEAGDNVSPFSSDESLCVDVLNITELEMNKMMNPSLVSLVNSCQIRILIHLFVVLPTVFPYLTKTDLRSIYLHPICSESKSPFGRELDPSAIKGMEDTCIIQIPLLLGVVFRPNVQYDPDCFPGDIRPVRYRAGEPAPHELQGQLAQGATYCMARLGRHV